MTVLPIVNRIDDYTTFIPDRHRQHDQLPTSIPDSSEEQFVALFSLVQSDD